MVKMDLRKYLLIGLASGAVGCAGPLNLIRDNKMLYKVSCNYPEPNDMPLTNSYDLDLIVRHICLESESGEKFTLTFRERNLNGKAKDLINDLSDKVEGEEVMISPEDILDAQNKLDDGCTVAGVKLR